MIRERVAKFLKLPNTLRIVMPEKVDRTRAPSPTDEQLIALAKSNHATESGPMEPMIARRDFPDEVVPPRAVEILRRKDGKTYIRQRD
jgi:hypothetical protein